MAFDWIESHRGLRDHPKTVTLAATWADRKTCVIGHLHELWWWSLEYAPDGIIRPAFYPLVVQACEWHGKPEKFWSGLVEAGFLDAGTDGYVVHDWEEYALRRLTRLKKDAMRKRDVRAEIAGLSGPGPPDKMPMSGSVSADRPPDKPPKIADISGTHATRGRDQPTDRPDARGSEKPLASTPTNPPVPPSDSDADAQGPSGTASALSQSQAPPPRWEEIAPGQHQGTPNGVGEVSLLTARCPRCERSMPVAEVENHDCQLVVGEPVQTPPARGRGGRGLHRVFGGSAGPPPEVLEELSRMAANPPTAEQIAAEAARLGLVPRGEA